MPSFLWLCTEVTAFLNIPYHWITYRGSPCFSTLPHHRTGLHCLSKYLSGVNGFLRMLKMHHKRGTMTQQNVLVLGIRSKLFIVLFQQLATDFNSLFVINLLSFFVKRSLHWDLLYIFGHMAAWTSVVFFLYLFWLSCCLTMYVEKSDDVQIQSMSQYLE